MFRAPNFHNKFEPNSVTFKGDSHDEFSSFIKKNRYVYLLFSWLDLLLTLFCHCFVSHGLVGHRKPENIEDFENPNVIAYYTVDYVNNVKRTNYWRNRILQVAIDNPEYRFAISATDEFRLELERFGRISYGEKPVIAASDKDGRTFKMSGEFSLVISVYRWNSHLKIQFI